MLTIALTVKSTQGLQLAGFAVIRPVDAFP